MVAAAEVAVWGRARPGAVRAGDGEESLVGRVVAGTAAVAGAKARRGEGGAWASKAACSEARAARARAAVAAGGEAPGKAAASAAVLAAMVMAAALVVEPAAAGLAVGGGMG